MMKMSRSQSMLVQSPQSKAHHNLSAGQLADTRREETTLTYTASTADIPQNSTLRLSTKLGADEARTAFNEDQVRLGPLQCSVTTSKSFYSISFKACNK